MRRTAIRELFGCLKAGDESLQGKKVTVCGWARTVRASNAIGFIELNDGSYFTSLQVVFENGKIDNYSEIAALNVGAAVCVGYLPMGIYQMAAYIREKRIKEDI